MNKIIAFITVTALFIILSSSCRNNSEEHQADDNKKDCVNPDAVNPNGSSELAILMREMTVFSQLLNESILRDSFIPLPDNFKTIHTAIPTDSTVKGTIFNGHAELYLNSLDVLYKGEKSDRINNFNNMITTCISCHENFCRGPIKRITKLKIM